MTAFSRTGSIGAERHTVIERRFISELLQLIAGSEVRCTDGRVGHVGGLIFDPAAATLTHVSVATHSPTHTGRLVPLNEVQSTSPVVQLTCARHDYYRLVGNEKFVSTVGPGHTSTVLHVHLVPHGETELHKDETVHAVDGRAGHLLGAVVIRETHAVQQLLVRIGHLSGRHHISIPYESVASIDTHGVHLRLSKDQLAGQSRLT